MRLRLLPYLDDEINMNSEDSNTLDARPRSRSRSLSLYISTSPALPRSFLVAAAHLLRVDGLGRLEGDLHERLTLLPVSRSPGLPVSPPPPPPPPSPPVSMHLMFSPLLIGAV